MKLRWKFIEKLRRRIRSLKRQSGFCGLGGKPRAIVELKQSGDCYDGEIEVKPEENLSFFQNFGNPNYVYHYQRARKIIFFRNVIVYPENSLIATRENRIVKESGLSGYRVKRFLKEDASRRKSKIFVKTPCTAIEQGSMDNYYHWYIDILPRIFGLYEPALQEIPLIQLLITEKVSMARREFLKALLPSNVKLQIVPVGSQIVADYYMHLPFLSDEWAGYLPKDYLEFFRERLETVIPREKARMGIRRRRILISRNDAGSRRLVNEEELAKALSGFGFEIHELGKYSLHEQIKLFRNAEAIVGMHGAGLTNMIYADNATVLEIQPSNYPGLNHYRLLAAALGHEYGNVAFGKIFRPDELQVPWKLQYSLNIHDADITVDPEVIVHRLEGLGIRDRQNAVGR